MDLLARREHSYYELEQKLESRGISADAIRVVLHELQNDGLLDDERFAESFVTYRAGKGQGPVRIRAELSQRGVSGGRVEILFESHDWLELARDVRQRKFGSDLPQEFSEKARQARFLTYRGFTGEQAMAALKTGD